MIDLVLDYITMENNLFFNILYKDKKLGEVCITNDSDCYVVMIDAYKDFRKKHYDDRTEALFDKIFYFVDHYDFIDRFNKPVLLLEDDYVASKYAVDHDLKRVPRYCGFYLYN